MKKLKRISGNLLLAGMILLSSAGICERPEPVIKKETDLYAEKAPGCGDYYVKTAGDRVVVYRSDHSIFDYADLDFLRLPPSLKREVREGKYFRNEAELYEFLENYTS